MIFWGGKEALYHSLPFEMQALACSLAHGPKLISDFQAFHNWALTGSSWLFCICADPLPTLHASHGNLGLGRPILLLQLPTLQMSAHQLFERRWALLSFLVVFYLQKGLEGLRNKSYASDFSLSSQTVFGLLFLGSGSPVNQWPIWERISVLKRKALDDGLQSTLFLWKEGRQLAEHVMRQQARGSLVRQRPSMGVLLEEWINCTSKSVWAQSRMRLTDCSPHPQNWQT